jgi:hypothetical protein
MARLARLEPEVAATGHGIPMHGTQLRDQLAAFVPRFDTLARPKVGRYAHVPATADGGGVTSVPPPLVKPWLKGLAVAGLAIGAVALATAGKGKKKGKKRKGSPSSDSPEQPQPRAKEGSYRAWYRDSPAGSPDSGFDNQAAGVGQSGPDHDQRYSDSWSRKIETQYP